MTAALQPGYLHPDIDLPEPMQDVEGIDYDDPLLKLDDASLRMRATVITIVASMWPSVLASRAKEPYERMKDPQDGDLVVESTSALYWAQRDPMAHRVIHGFGYLLGHRLEWGQTRVEWLEAVARGDCGPEERYADQITYVQYGPTARDIARWSNCMWIAVPTERVPR